MKKYVIIGANSKIARNFVYYLRDKPVDLCLYDMQDKSFDGCCDYVSLNILNKSQLNTIDFNCDAIYMFAGLTGMTTEKYMAQDFIAINEIGLLNVLDAMVEQKSKAIFVYPSSRLVYKEDSSLLDETSQTEGRSIYAVTKIAAEQYIKVYGATKGLNYTILRIAIPFGVLNPNIDSYGIVSKFVEQAKCDGQITLYGNGQGRRTFSHIADICQIFDSVASTENCKNQTFNIGGHVYTLEQVAKKIAEKYNAKIKFIPWPELAKNVDVRNGALNSSKLDMFLNDVYRNIDFSNKG